MINKQGLQRLTRDSDKYKYEDLLTNALDGCQMRAKDGRGESHQYIDGYSTQVTNKVINKLRSLGLEVEFRNEDQIKITWDRTVEERRQQERVLRPRPIRIDPTLMINVNDEATVAQQIGNAGNAFTDALINGRGTVQIVGEQINEQLER